MPIDVTRVLTEVETENYRVPANVTNAQANAILEVAYLTAAANRDWSEEEARSFRSLVGPVRALTTHEAPVAPTDDDLETLLDEIRKTTAHATFAERATALAGVLVSDDVRALAYKVAFAMSICDLATGDDETEFLDTLADAFGLGTRADELASEVYAAVDDAGEEPQT